MSQSDLRDRLDKLVKRVGTTTLSDAELNQALTFGVRLFSQWSPRHLVTEVDAGGGSAYIDLPSGYVWETSQVEWVEYPTGGTPPTILVTGEDYIFHRTSTALQLQFLRSTPDAGDDIRIAYTVEHTLNGSVDTIPAPLSDAVVYLGGMSLAESMASYFTRTVEPTLEADVVNFDTRAQTWTSLARRWERRAKTLLGMQEDETVPAASVSADLDVLNTQQRSYLTHPRTLR